MQLQNSYNIKDLTGLKFGKLTALRYVKREPYKCKRPKGIEVRYRYFWEFRCDCGKIIVARKDHISHYRQVSCGCSRGGLEIGQASLNDLYTSYQRDGAKKRGLEFHISKEDFKNLITQNCHYCNTEPANYHESTRCRGGITYNGLDRIDNTKGYLLDNVVPCCKICNFAKKNYSQEDFLNWIKRVVKHTFQVDL